MTNVRAENFSFRRSARNTSCFCYDLNTHTYARKSTGCRKGYFSRNDSLSHRRKVSSFRCGDCYY